MEKMHCDIIRDLIPSYVDEVCTQATKECVEEHIRDCGECRLIAAKLRDQTLSGETLEQKGLDGLKKIRNTLQYQNIICCVLLIFILFLGVLIFFVNRYTALFYNQPLPFIVCLLVALLFASGRKGNQPPEKRAFLLTGLSLAVNVYFILLFTYTVHQLTSGAEVLFGFKELNKTGPFLENQLIAAYFVQTALLLYNFYSIMRRDRDCHWMLCLNLTSIFLLFHYDVWLKNMDNFETLKRSLFQNTFLLMGIGAGGIALCLLITRNLRQKRRTGHT